MFLNCVVHSLSGPFTATRASDEYIVLLPPNGIMFEVQVSGAYESIRWYRDGESEIVATTDITLSQFRQTLNIMSTSSSDVGRITANVTDGTTTLNIMFQVRLFCK